MRSAELAQNEYKLLAALRAQRGRFFPKLQKKTAYTDMTTRAFNLNTFRNLTRHSHRFRYFLLFLNALFFALVCNCKTGGSIMCLYVNAFTL